MSNPCICQCGCHSLTRQVASYAASLERDIEQSIKWLSARDDSMPYNQKSLAEKITILTYLKGLP